MTPQQPVARIPGARPGSKLRRLLIAGGGQDQAVDVLETPVVVDQLVGEPVEQIRVRGQASVDPEIAGGFDQAGSEVVLPEPVDNHAGEQRVAWVSDPAGQRAAAGGVGSIGLQREVGGAAGDD